MVKNWIIVCGVASLLAASAGCGVAPAELNEEPEIIGTAGQAEEMGPLWKSFGINAYHFDAALGHALPTSTFFGLKYGLHGAEPSRPLYSYTGVYRISGFSAGRLYGFEAAECVGRPWALGAACNPYSDPIHLYSPAMGTKWAVGSTLGSEQLAQAYPAGRFLIDGVETAVPFCAGVQGNSLYPGYFRDGACKFGVAGAEYSTPNAVVLTSPGEGAYFKPYARGLVPAGAMIAGYAGGKGLYGCQGVCESGLAPGWTTGGACNVACYGQGYRGIESGEVLIAGSLVP